MLKTWQKLVFNQQFSVYIIPEPLLYIHKISWILEASWSTLELPFEYVCMKHSKETSQSSIGVLPWKFSREALQSSYLGMLPWEACLEVFCKAHWCEHERTFVTFYLGMLSWEAPTGASWSSLVPCKATFMDASLGSSSNVFCKVPFRDVYMRSP